MEAEERHVAHFGEVVIGRLVGGLLYHYGIVELLNLLVSQLAGVEEQHHALVAGGLGFRERQGVPIAVGLQLVVALLLFEDGDNMLLRTDQHAICQFTHLEAIAVHLAQF